MRNYLTVLCITLSIVLFTPFVASADGWVLWEKAEVTKKGLEHS